MPKPLKVRRANEIVGLFVLLALAIALAAALFGPRTQRWFTPSQTLAIHLPPEGSLGLRKGGDVLILGSVVGSVEDIIVTDAGNMEAEVNIRGNFIRFVRKDSKAIIRKPLGIGDASIEITRGYGDPLPARGGFLESVADKGPTEFMEETLAAIRDEAMPAIKELRGTVVEYGKLASELRSDRAAALKVMQRLDRVGAALEKGEGLAGMLLFDPRPAAQLRAALPRINAALDELHATLRNARALSATFPQIGQDVEASAANLRASSADAKRFAAALSELSAALPKVAAVLPELAAALPELERSIRQSTDAAPGVLLQAQEALRQIQRLTEALQRHWLIRGSMEQPQSGTRIDSDRVGTER